MSRFAMKFPWGFGDFSIKPRLVTESGVRLSELAQLAAAKVLVKTKPQRRLDVVKHVLSPKSAMIYIHIYVTVQSMKI